MSALFFIKNVNVSSCVCLALFIITKVTVTSSDCLPFSLLQSVTWIHQIVCAVHYYKGDRQFIRMYALFIITNANVISSVCLRYSLIKREPDFIRLRWLLLQIGTWLHQIVCVVQHYERERDFIIFFALFFITKWYVTSSDCLLCLLWHSGM